MLPIIRSFLLMNNNLTLCEKIGIFITIILVIVFGATQYVVMPSSVGTYSSIYFSVSTACLQYAIIALIMMLATNRCKIVVPDQKITTFFCGLFGEMMTIFYVYSADPSRTQPIMQIILTIFSIFPSVIMTRFILKKINSYKKRYIIPSIVFLLASIVLTIIPIKESLNKESIIWILMFVIAIICSTFYSIYQEKYIMDKRDKTFANKMVLIFWTRFIQLIIVAMCFWVEFIIGHNPQNPLKSFLDSWTQFTTNKMDVIILKLGIVTYLLSDVVSTFMNAISTNYNMVASAGSQPVAILFFTIFSEFNTGIKYSWYMSVLCSIFSLISIGLWTKGETKASSHYQLPISNSDSKLINNQIT